MTEFEALVYASISFAVLITFVVMVFRRPSEMRKEKFEKRRW